MSDRTIERKLPVLSEHGAHKDDTGTWQIPPHALRAAGLHPGRPTPSDGVTHPHDGPGYGEVVVPVQTLIDLKEQVARLAGENQGLIGQLAAKDEALTAKDQLIHVLEAAPAAVVDLRDQPQPAAVTSVPSTWREWRKARKATKPA